MANRQNQLLDQLSIDKLKSLVDDSMEQTLLGTLMSYDGLYLRLRDKMSENMFYNIKWRELYKVICEVGDAGQHPNMIAINHALKTKCIDTITAYDLAQTAGMSSITNVEHDIAVLNALASRRKLWEQGMRLAVDAVDLSVDIDSMIVDRIKSIEESVFHTESADVHSLDDVLTEVRQIIDTNQNEQMRRRGGVTGFRKIDAKGGWQATNLIIVAADSSQGKSSFALNTALSCMEYGQRCAFYSLEMTREQLVSRILSSKTGIPSNSILWDKLTYNEYCEVTNKMHEMSSRIGRSLFFDDKSTSSLEQIVNSIRMQKAQHNIDGAVVDYIQILNVNDKSQQSAARRMGDAARILKNLAKELNIWILALSQLSRDRDNPVPTMARIRDSGEIGEAADIILTIYRAEIYGRRYPEPFETKSTKGTAMIDICKGRNIGLLKFLVWFDANRTQFIDADAADIPDMGYIQKNDDEPDF